MSNQSDNIEIVENIDAWYKTYQENWLAHLLETGEPDYKGRYKRTRNKRVPSGPGIDVAQSRIMLISSAGGYLPDQQAPFEKSNLLGDYTIRQFPLNTPFEKIDFAHEHYDLAAVKADPQVLLPLRHLEDMVGEGIIGEMASTVISYSGYQPDATRTVHEVIPEMLNIVRGAKIQGVLLVPA